VTPELLTALRQIVRKAWPNWIKFFPSHGPCWPICRALSDAGFGVVNFCKTKRASTGRWYGHYVLIARDGSILDFSGEYYTGDNPTVEYKEFLEFDKPEHFAWPGKCVKWWAKRLQAAL
jgi:hypothetical protein